MLYSPPDIIATRSLILRPGAGQSTPPWSKTLTCC